MKKSCQNGNWLKELKKYIVLASIQESPIYREGKVAFPDALNKPSRTLLTREGGNYISREKHIVFQNGRYRRLHPIELERLNGFPDDFTKCDGITDNQRAFFMGNALVIGVVKKLGKELARAIHNK